MLLKIASPINIEKVVRACGPNFLRWMPWKMVCLRYWRGTFVAVQWVWVGLCMNYESLLIAKDMFECVNERYWRLSIILQNYLLSTEGVPSNKWRGWLVERGVQTSLAPLMLVRDSISLTDWCWERNSPDLVGITSTPRKNLRAPYP